MKKRICSIFTTLMILLVCVFAGACGNKYENMEFKVLYAFSEDAEIWNDGTDGITLNYGEDIDGNDNGPLVFNEQGVAQIFVKVEVKNVKAKHIDSITVSFGSLTGLNFSPKRVKEGKVFSIDVTGNVTTVMKLYENNSGKKSELSFVISRRLKSITADADLMPALAVNGSLNLLALNNLTYEPLHLTNQIGVKYSIDSIGGYDAGHVYVPVIPQGQAQTSYVDMEKLENGILSFKNTDFFAANAYVVRIKATSIFHDGVESPDVISAVFDVYVVDDEISAPLVKFVNSEGKQISEQQNYQVNLYDNGGETYSKSTLFMDQASLVEDENKYVNGLFSSKADLDLRVTTAIYVLNSRNEYEKYEFGEDEYQSGINGLVIDNCLTNQNIGDENTFIFSILNRETPKNRVKVVSEIKGLDFSCSQNVSEEFEFEVIKGVLPTRITINDAVDLENGNTASAVVYGTAYEGYNGLELKISANPNDNPQRKMLIAPDAGLLVSDAGGHPVNDYIVTGGKIFVKFKDGVSDEQDLTIKTLNVPEYYNGEEIVVFDDSDYLTITYKINKLVTADAFEFISDGKTDEHIVEDDKKLILNAEHESNIYVRVYHSGLLDLSTIKLESNNDSILFGNGLKNINLSDANVAKYGETKYNEDINSDYFGMRYSIYRIPVLASNKKVDANIKISAGNGEIGLDESVNVSSVYLMSDTALSNLNVDAVSGNVKEFEDVDNGAFNFAVNRGEFAEFSVVDGNGKTNTIEKLSLTAVEIPEVLPEDNFSSQAVSYNIISNSVFVAMGRISGKTQVLNLVIEYYEYDEDSDVILLLNSNPKQIQIAVYDAISNVSASSTKDKIGFVNEYYKETAEAIITYNAKNANAGSPAKEVVFRSGDDNIKKTGASDVKVVLNNNVNLGNYAGKIKIEYETGTGYEELRFGENLGNISGNIKITLSGEVTGLNEISLTIIGVRFGMDTNIVANISIKVVRVEKAQSIVISGDNFVNVDGNNEIQLSFMNVGDGGYDEKDFSAELTFNLSGKDDYLYFSDIGTALTHLLYKYEQDASGRWVLHRISDDFLRISYADGKVSVRAYKNNGGGLFKLVLATKDSYIHDEDPNAIILTEEYFDLKQSIDIRVSDGVEIAYPIWDIDDLYKINNNLSSKFALCTNLDLRGDEFIPLGFDGTRMNAFKGTLTGKPEKLEIKYSISLMLKTPQRSDEGNVLGLFGILDEGACVENLKVNASFAENGYDNVLARGLKVGSVAAVNFGRIENVDVTIISPSTIKFGSDGVGTIDFGGIVGLNSNTGSVLSSRIECSSCIAIETSVPKTHNIGLIAGTNNGTIQGKYNSKENLNGFVYDVIANINVKANTNGGGFNVNLGAVGCNTANVKNVLVGGKIVAEQGGSNLLEGYIGGIVGHSNGGTVSTVVALGLDIDSTNSNMYSVGGIVGKASENAKVDYAKFVSVIIKNLASIGDTHGQINAKGNVAGIIAQADSGVEIIYSSVESFIDQIYDAGVGDFKTFETLISENNVAGIALGNAKINQSFVNANMYAGTSDTIGNAYLIGNSEASCSNNYFIGKVEKGTKHNNNTTYVIDISEFSIVDFDTTYMESVAVDEKTSVWDNIYIDNRDGTYTKANTYDNTKTYKKFKATAWKSYAESLVSSWDNAIWAIQQNYNVIKYNGVSLFFPYLLRAYNNGTEDVSEILMIVAPEEMSSSINTDYVLDTNSIWIKEFDYDKYNIVESVIVNYLNAATEEDNSHNVLNTSEIDGEPNGLIDLTFLPNNAQGGWAFDILGPGRRFAYINSEKKIVFTSASGSTPILVRIYSVFNPEIETYVLIYTQCLYEDLQLSSSALYATTNSDYKYEMNLYTGQENNVISFKADNGKGDNGENNSTIFDVYGLKQYIKVEVVSDKVDSKLSIGESPAYNNMSLSIKKNDFTANYYETVEFRLYLLKKYFNVVDVDDEILNGVEAILLDTIKVKVNFFNAAHSIVVNGEDAEISTHEDISFEVYLYSEFIDEDSTRVVKSHYVNEYGEILLNEGEPTDSIKIKFDYDENDAQIIELMSTNNVNHFAQLFDLTIVREVFERNKKGYYYSINLELINDRNYRYITSAVQYDIIVYATSNPTVNTETDPMNVVLKPTSVSTARIENYTVNKINVNTDYTDIVKCSDLQTSIVEPGSLGNVMIIYLEPAYSNVVSATIKSSSLFVPSKGKDVTMRFSQLVLDERGGTYKYTTLYGGHNSQVGDTLALNTISKIDADGNRLYTGIIYVYIQLEEFAGLEDTMTVELNVETNDGKQITRTRDLLTKYMPGVDIQYDNSKKVAGGYLIQQGTSNNEFKVKIYGYQFNKNPRVRFEWNISEADSDYSIVDKDNKDTISDGTKNYLTGDYVSYIWNKNYDEIEHNLDDDSYTITLNLNVDPKIMASFKMIIDFDLTTKDGQIEEKSAEIVLYPTDYILTGVNVTGLHGGRKNILINKSSAVEFGFTTDNDVNDLSDELYEKLLTYAEADENGLKYGLTSKFAYYQNGGWISFAEENKHPEFELNLVNEKLLTILGVSKFTNLVEFKIWYGYTANNNGVYSFGFGQAGDITSSKSCSFTLNIVPPDEILEIPIYSADELYNPASQTWHLEENVHYILMNDIVLENVVPITTPIAQFDGNNRVISIKSFAVNPANTEFGLFGKVGTYTIEDLETEEEIIKQTIIKNVIVDYSKFEGTLALNHCTTKELVFGGLIAVNDGGLIYNCDVMNLANGTDAQVDVIVAGDADITFGGLVGINKGIITNSRVGRNSYIKITATKTIESYVERKAGGLTFSIYNTKYEESNVNQFKVVAGGFVGQNVNTISTSYVEKTNLINYSTNETTNLTAGFVGENSGTILSSYSKADDATITITNPRAKGYVVENKGNGIVSGFVYNNLGTITDAYANIELATKSAYISGFVYNNTGKISEAYSACIMNAGGVDNNAEQPFIGVDNAGNLLSNGVIENCYYLMRSNVDNPYYQGDKDVALGLNEENIQDSAHLIGFAFVLSNLKDEREQGIWSYYTTSSKKRMLPELMNANMVAHSYRYVIDPEAPEVKFDYAKAYAPGTVNNPYTISNVEEYNDVFTEHGQSLNGQKGYVRFINNINFNNDETAIKTRTNYTLGSESLSERTSVEGNGLTISGIYFDAGEEIVKEIGLFAHIENAYIKNLNLEFATPTTDGQFSTQTAMYSGGLAGSMNNSVVLNVSLKGNNTTLTGRNFVGGVAGYVSGNSLIYGIETNLNIKAIGSTNNLYYNETDYKKLNIKSYSGIEDYASYINTLSYAGGVAGVLDLTSRKNVEHNIQYIDIHGDQMNEKIFNGEVEANILGEYAGGVAGYANENTSSYRLRYFTGEKEYIEGKTAVGGLFGAYMGKIVASQVTTEEDTQYTYDTIIGEYVLSITDLDDASKETLNTEEIGNLKLLKSYGYAGGLIGLGLKSSISSCYAKAGFAAGKHIGGLIGLSVSSDINYSYAIPYINSYAEMSYVGGLIGSAYGINNKIPERNYEISAYEALLRYKGNSNVNTSIIFTYSTIIFDLNTFVKPANAVIDFISANYKDSENVYLQSGAAKSFVHVYSGTIRHIENIVSNQTLETNNCSKMQLFRLFNVGDPDQTVSFQEVFGGWEITQYWLLKEEKYFPLLTHEPINNYINIDDQYDLEIVKNNPTGKYRVVNSFEINANSLLNNNWIIESTFKGIMIGEIEGSSYRPAITIKGLKPNRSDESAGFFKETENATISNIEFVWAPINMVDVDNLTMVSGLTCKDTESLITNVEVRTSYTIGDATTGYFINETGNSINGFAGIVGVGDNTNVLDCKFIGKVNALLSGEQEIFVGGIAAQMTTKPDLEGTAVVNNSTIGARAISETGYNETIAYSTTQFNFTIQDNGNAVYIGGILGKGTNAGVSACSMGSTEYTEGYQFIGMNITINEEQYVYIGGAVGYAEEGLISKVQVLTNIKLLGAVPEGNPEINIAGLAGTYVANKSLTTGIKNCSVNATIVTDASFIVSNTTNVILSTGVANLAATMQQCLFTGEINTEASTDITIIYAGGAVARVTTSSEIEEVITNTAIIVGTSKTATIYVGGLVGWASGNVKTSYSASWGRIVPITKGDAADLNIFVGGLIGKINQVVAINNSYTISSILTDSIATAAITELNVGALFGGLNEGANLSDVTTEAVYYSSDFALCADENYVGDSPMGINMSAQSMIMSEVWQRGLKTEGGVSNAIWTTLMVGGNYRMPHLYSLEEDLKKFDLINPLSEDYKTGTAMNPKKIYGTDSQVSFSSDYTYYLLLMSGTESKITATFTSELKGIVLGQEAEFTVESISNTVDSNYGIIPVVGKHSAISNLHIRMLPSVTMAYGGGVIAGCNNGVIFNSSVQGSGVTITAGADIGLIAAVNKGMVSHCYSTAEIIESSINIGGIVHTNGGKLLSNYFTGYINSTGAAAGIMFAVDGSSNYAFNNYMGGVISCEGAMSNKFAASATSFEGSNNYIDKYVDLNYNSTETNLIAVSTSTLMSEGILKGKWYYNVENKKIKALELTDDPTDEPSAKNYVPTFGRNYNYPVYRFNKYVSKTSEEMEINDWKYQLFTGTGEL